MRVKQASVASRTEIFLEAMSARNSTADSKLSSVSVGASFMLGVPVNIAASQRMPAGDHVGHLLRRDLFALHRTDHPAALHDDDTIANPMHVADIVVDDHDAESIVAGNLNRLGYLLRFLD